MGLSGDSGSGSAGGSLVAKEEVTEVGLPKGVLAAAATVAAGAGPDAAGAVVVLATAPEAAWAATDYTRQKLLW